MGEDQELCLQQMTEICADITRRSTAGSGIHESGVEGEDLAGDLTRSVCMLKAREARGLADSLRVAVWRLEREVCALRNPNIYKGKTISEGAAGNMGGGPGKFGVLGASEKGLPGGRGDRRSERGAVTGSLPRYPLGFSPQMCLVPLSTPLGCELPEDKGCALYSSLLYPPCPVWGLVQGWCSM